jgi:HK97 family phage major capsid protein
MKQKLKNLRFGAVSILGLFALTLVFAICGESQVSLATLAILPFAFAPLRFLEADKGGGAGGEDAAFRSTVLDGVKAIKTKQDELVSNYDNLQKETKKAFEELTQLKNHQGDIQEKVSAISKINLAMRRETRMAYGDPVRRISGDDQLRASLNVAVRLAAGTPGARNAAEAIGKALTTGTTPGSTMMIDDLANEFYDILATYGVWNTFAVRRVGTKVTKFPVRTARPVSKFVRKLSNAKLAEDATINATRVDCNVELAGVLLGVETELLEDSEFDVTGYVLEDFAEALALHMDQICLTADGTDDADDSLFSGIFTTGTGVTATATRTTVEALKFEDVLKVLTSVAPVVLTRPSRWWVHPTTLARMLAIKDENGRPIFLTATEAPTYGGLGSILGYAVTPSHAAPSANTASSKVAAFGDPSGYVFGLRNDFGFAASDDFQFDSVSRTFRGTARFGGITRRANAFGILTLPAS